MKAITQDRYGDADVLQLRDIPRPAPGEGDVLVEVHAAGCGPDVWHVMTGRPYFARAFLGLRRPRWPALGRDLAGVVVEVGPGVTDLAIGDEVYGDAASGSFAEYAVARATSVARKPAALSFEEAAAVPVSGCTALQAVQRARLDESSRVLVIGAGGGVGTYATQLAAATGARVTGVCSASKAELVRSLGSHDVIDYTRDEITRDGAVHDLVIDTAGNRPISLLRKAMTHDGTLVLVGGDQHGGALLGGFQRQLLAGLRSPFVSQTLVGLMATVTRESLDTLTAHIDADALHPQVSRTYELNDAAEAVTAIGTAHTQGKLVVRTRP